MSVARDDAPPTRMRVFIAAWPSDDFLDALSPIDRWLTRESTHRVIPRPQRHLTLAFIGDIEAALLPPLTTALHDAAAGLTPFEVHARGVTGFPSPEKPRIVAMEFEDSRPLHACFDGVLRAVSEVAPVETVLRDLDRRRTPHLTLARTRNTRNARRLQLAKAPQVEACMAFASIQIVRSHLTNAGPEYEILTRIALGPAR